MKQRLRAESRAMALAKLAATRRAAWRGQRPELQDRTWIAWLARLVLLLLLLTSLSLVLLLLAPYLHAIVLAVLLASLFRPVHAWLSGRLRGRRNLSAFLAVLSVFITILLPSGVFMSALVKEGIYTFDAANQWLAEGKLQQAMSNVDMVQVFEHPLLKHLEGTLASWFEVGDLSEVDLSNSKVTHLIAGFGKILVTWTADHIKPLLVVGGRFLMGFGIMLFVMFFAFRDGRDTLATIQRLSPLPRTQEGALLARIRDVSKAVVLGTGVTAAAQGAAGMIAFYLVGIPALFWGTVLAAASIVPVVGTALVWVPAVGFLLLRGRFTAAIFLALWCMFIVGSIDNFLRPFLMGGRVGMSSVAVFFSIIGGIEFFGPVGIVYGPLIFGLCAVCLYIYESENADFLSRQDRL